MNMDRTKRVGLIFGLAIAALARCGFADAAEPLYTNDFSQAKPGEIPQDFLVMDGQFEVKEADGERFLELPGAPLENFGVLFGPSRKGNVRVQARIHSAGKGRRFPVFGVSVGGVSGYRLLVAPAKKMLELWRGESLVSSAPFAWTSGRWTSLVLEVRKSSATWDVAAKGWEGADEPKDWSLKFQDNTEPVAGRAGVWGQPFAGTPIRFDDLKVFAIE
jgi:hypothetical protein